MAAHTVTLGGSFLQRNTAKGLLDARSSVSYGDNSIALPAPSSGPANQPSRLRIQAAVVDRPGSAARGNSSSSGNGASKSSSSPPTRMVPIDVALQRIRDAKASNRLNDAARKSTTNGSLSSNGTLRSGTVEIVKGEYDIVPSGSASNGAASGLSRAIISANTISSSTFSSNGTISSNSSLVPVNRSVLAQLDGGRERPPPSDSSYAWSNDEYSPIQRSIDVWSRVLTLRARLFMVDTKWTYIGGFSEAKQRLRRRRLAAWLREAILELGPTFIKLGQLFSTRSDLLPAEFVEELSKLQDRVPAFSEEKAIAFIQAELKEPISLLFAEFEGTPIAAASLGQVHRAVLPNGEVVVVKVQRPGLKQLFDIDLENLRLVAEYFQGTESMGGPTRDWIGIYDECCTVLYNEIDYINEGRNADRFRRDFRKYPWVRVPAVYWDYTSGKVLTLSYMPGVKISEVAQLDAIGVDRALVAQRAIEAYLIQILKTGFFHADPHPGNLAVLSDNSIIYYDFGMMGEIPAFTKDRLMNIFYAVYEKDAKKVIDALIELKALVPTGDLNSVRRAIQFFLNNLTGPKMERDATISAVGEDLFAIAADQPFRFPATFTFVLRAFTTLEGVGNTLDPNFSFPKIAAPYAQELLDVRDSTRPSDYVVQQLRRQASEVTESAVAMPVRVARIDDLMQQLETGDLKLRVRVLESERSARRSGLLQVATLNAVAAGSLLNVGLSLSQADAHTPATACFAAASLFAGGVLWGMKRVQRLDKFEKLL